MYDAIYARQSVEKADSISVESQIEFCKFETRGGEYKSYIDRGFSGKNTNRPAFEEMLRDVKKGIIKRVIVYKLDRISRSILDFSNMMETFEKHNVQFVSSTEKFDTQTPIGRAMLSICIVFAQLERETIQKRVADSYYSRSKKGFYMGGRVPYGFSLEKTVINGIQTSKYAPKSEEIEQIKLMYLIYSQPGKSLRDILKYFSEQGLKNLRGKTWCTARLSEILRNPIYVKADFQIYDFYKNQGVNVVNSAEEFTGENACYLYKGKSASEKHSSLENKNLVLAPHEGVVESNLWLKCRMKSQRSRHAPAGRRAKNSWLVGKMKCGNCGYALVVRKSGGKNKEAAKYFICSNKASRGCCKGCKALKAKDLENLMFEMIKNKLSKWSSLSASPRSISNPKINERKMKISKIDEEIEELLKKVLNADDALMNYINARVKKLDEKREMFSKELAFLQGGSSSEGITDYISKWNKMSLEDKIEVLGALVEVVHISEEKIEITWKI